jgi:hypothetical protein
MKMKVRADGQINAGLLWDESPGWEPIGTGQRLISSMEVAGLRPDDRLTLETSQDRRWESRFL